MNRTYRNPSAGTGRSGGLWPVLAVLVATVLVPSACVLWFMQAAMQNESLAVRQRLGDVYGRAAEDAATKLQQYCSAKAAELVVPAGVPAAEVFSRLISADVADAVVIRDDAGQPLYPSTEPPSSVHAMPQSDDWRLAEALEFRDGNALGAAAEYAKIAAYAKDPDTRAQAMLARARCLAKAGRKERTVTLLCELAGDPELSGARDGRGRLVAPSAMLFALQLTARADSEEFGSMAASLAARLKDYSQPEMPASQRRFLMEALEQLDPSAAVFATLPAENLAAEYLLRDQPAVRPEQIVPTSLSGVWQLGGPGGKVVALLHHQRLREETDSAIAREQLSGMRISVRPPVPTEADGRAFLSIPAGPALPGWTVQVHLTGEDPFALAAQRRRAAHLWTAGVGIVMIAALALAVSYHVNRQVRLTRLKNDLIATVSHELKTPLSSMRLLTDTLLERRYGGQQQAEEYFALIAKENERLSRLIDNFLNFSRMERNRRAFEFAQVSAEELVKAAMRAAPDWITQPPCHFQLQVGEGCPAVLGDRDALVTVVLNLLDNAYKYSKEPRHIELRAFGRNGRLCLTVSDNGIGLSRRSARRVFHRFYQVDRSLSRSVGGCGLGLSIVKFIVDAHGGTVVVSSRLGQGSTFTVMLPALASGASMQADNEG